MFHLSDRLLAKLIDGSATTADLQRIRRHVDECRACARRLEEWRDNFAEVDERFPELAVDAGPLATVHAGGLVMLPGSEPSRRVVPDLNHTPLDRCGADGAAGWLRLQVACGSPVRACAWLRWGRCADSPEPRTRRRATQLAHRSSGDGIDNDRFDSHGSRLELTGADQ